MPASSISEKRLQSLRKKLALVSNGEGLESLAAKAGSRGLENALDDEGLDALHGTETAVLTKLKNGDFGDISGDQAMRLEAVVEREFRQVVFINDGQFADLPHPWTHFNADPIRQRLTALIPSVGRVERLSVTGRRTDHVGTGFIVGEGLMMTNRHVAEVFVRGAGNQPLVFKPGLPARYDFGREVGFIASDLSGTLAIKKVKLIHPFWDMALFELESLPEGAKPMPLSVMSPEDLDGREMAAIGYPGRGRDMTAEAQRLEQQYFGGVVGVKRLAAGLLEGREPIISFGHHVQAMTHDASTQPGTSGSAIIDVRTGEVVGLHFKGITLKANYSVPTHELARDPRVIDAGVLFTGTLPAATSEWEAWWQNPGRQDGSVETSAPASLPVIRPGQTPSTTNPNPLPMTPPSPDSTGANRSVPGADGSCTWTIPIQVTVSIGSPAGGATLQAAPAVGKEESFQIPVMYDGMDQRAGYNPDFLGLPGGEKVPLPTLTAAGEEVAARQQNGETELKYHHFSVVMHAKRRIALFTAANLDWRKERHEVNGRKPSRSELSEIPEGVMEQWVTDDRIPDEAQLPDVFFTRDRQAFDKGHLVRRDDVAWGDSFEDIQMANGDTYYTTNCSPQVKGFNQAPHGDYNWGDLENMIQKSTKAEKVMLVSGPVLAKNDRFFAGVSESGPLKVQIPRRFWKIIVAMTADGLKAFGFMPEQDLSEVPTTEEFALPADWEDLLVDIRDIEKNLFGLVSLDWFKKHDARRDNAPDESAAVTAGAAAIPAEPEAPRQADRDSGGDFYRAALDQKGFSWSNALNLAIACRVAGKSSPEWIRQVAATEWGYPNCQTFACADARGLVAWDMSSVIVAFAEADDIGAWLQNLSILSVSRPYGKLHKGLFNSFETVREALKAILVQSAPAGKSVWLAGHGLGGALAMIAAAECFQPNMIAGLITYGQPGTGDQQTCNYFQKEFSGRYHRIVNGDDLVPRIPPRYPHAGQLHQIDQDAHSGETTGSSVDLPGPTDWLAGINLPHEAEGSAWTPSAAAQQDDTLWPRKAPAAHGAHEGLEAAGLPETAAASWLDQLTGSVRTAESAQSRPSAAAKSPVSLCDHKLGRYIKRIRRYTGILPSSDEALQHAIESVRQPSLRAGFEAAVPEKEIPVLIQLKGARWTPPLGLNVQSRMGTMVTAHATPSQIQGLQADVGVDTIDYSREAGVLELDHSIACVCGVPPGQRPPFGEDGDAVIIATIDSGIDILHHAFRDANGNTRILAVWDQRSAVPNRSPKAVTNGSLTQDYGELHLRASIQSLVAGPPGAVPAALRDPDIHGTHVASIAAGRPVPPFAGGMAPEARIIAVIPNMVTSPGNPPSVGYSNSHVDALAFIQSMAKAVDLPVVVNVSLGMNAGAHDGTSTLEAAFETFSGKGRTPGFAIVKSAGNERGYNGRALAVAAKNGISEISWESKPVHRLLDYFEAWFDLQDDIEFKLIAPAGAVVCGPVSLTALQDVQTTGTTQCRLKITPSHPDNGRRLLAVYISEPAGNIPPGTWTLEILGKSIDGSGEIHAWVERDERRAVEFAPGCISNEMTLSIPGTAETVITIGACGSTEPLRLTKNSSWGITFVSNGPGRLGFSKPEICAPGQGINAAHANQADPAAVVPLTGTSMAAPHVAGAIALLFSRLHKTDRASQVNARQIQAALIRCGGNRLHNKGFGHGRLDVAKFLSQFPLPAPGPGGLP